MTELWSKPIYGVTLLELVQQHHGFVWSAFSDSLGIGDREFMAKKLTSSTLLLWVKLVYFHSFIKAFPLQ